MGKSVIRTSALALALLLLPSLALAAGLGKLTVFSGLGQPLKAEIELLAIQKGEADNLSVRLPSADAFRTAHIEYSGVLLSLTFSIEQRSEAHYVVVLSSAQPINEPFLDLLVELDWATGRLVREYTFLLDPPEYKGQPSTPAMLAPAVAPVIRSVEMPKQPIADAGALETERSAAAPSAAAPKAAAASKVATRYKVKRGDTLTKIANAHKSDGVSLQQMLIALYRSNADAFDDNNINRMRAGKILNIPDMDAAASVDPNEAKRTVWAHAADFNEYRRKLGAAVATARERAEERRQSVSGKITARVEDKPAAAKVQDQLKLSKAQEPGKPGAKPSLQGTQEDLFAKEKELKEANERIAMLEKNLQDMQKLLALKSQSGAQLQQQASKADAAKAVEPVKTPEPAKAPDAVKPPEPARMAAPEKAKDAVTAAPKAPAPKAAAPKPKLVAPPPPAPEPSLFDEILENELAPYLGVLLLLLFAGYFYYAWRRKKTQQMQESSVMGAPDLAHDSVFGAAGGAQVDTGTSEIQGEFSQGGATSASDTEEVDPIAEADVYMAYGRDTQAEEILKEALVKNPSRQPIRVKLLEIYANRKDAAAFESVAAELHAASNGEGAEWQKALSLGAQLDPENPLYGAMAAEGGAHADADTQVVSAVDTAPDILLDTGEEQEASSGLDFDLGLSEPLPGDEPQPAADAAPSIDVTADLGFDLDLGGEEPKPEPAAAPATEATADLGFGLDLGGEEQPPKAAAEQPSEPVAGEALSLEGSVAEAPADTGSSIDFDFELPGADTATETAAPEATAETGLPALEVPEPAEATVDTEVTELAEAPAVIDAPAVAEGGGGIDFDFDLDLPEQKEETPAAPLDLSAISLDLGSSGEEALPPDAHWQEVATKLDLAKAYQEMGDKDGARELLNEVLNEGDAAQQQQAQTMLTALE